MNWRAWVCAGVLAGCAPSQAATPASLTNPTVSELLPVGIRRLTNREFVRAAEALLRAPLPPEFEASLPPDVRSMDGYTRHRAQTMSPALAVKLAQELPLLVEERLASGESRVFDCEAGDTTCVEGFISSTLERAYRRPSDATLVAEMSRLFAHAAATGKPSDGAAAVLSALLQAPSLWYVTEHGEVAASPDGWVRLSGAEIANQLAFVIRGQGADSRLLADVAALGDPDVRRAHARRLLADVDARQHYREFVLQWLEVDELMRTAKSSSVFEPYDTFKSRMVDETVNFADEVFVHEGASLRSLLTAGFVSVDPNMAVFYGLQQFGARVDSRDRGRLGVLQHASFLAAHAHADTTSPVLRGDFVLRKVLCERVPRPSELDLEIIMPRPSTELTRREQFAWHGADPQCADCHDRIDGFGLTLERFDAAGRARTTELGKPVRTDGAVTYQGERVTFGDASELSRWLAAKPEAADCFARHAFRFVTGQHEPAAEDAFVALRYELPITLRDNLLEHLVAYVGTDAFIRRRVQ